MANMIEDALKVATDTKACVIGDGVFSQTAKILKEQFPGAKEAVLVVDPRTWAAAGEQIAKVLEADGIAVSKYVVCEGLFHAEMRFVDETQAELAKHPNAVPVAVGSGVINDTVKLAAGRLGIKYMVCATAASVDGYTAYGASITYQGAKQTFLCPAPLAVIADMDVIIKAPPEMAAGGYADLLAKVVAGADWIIAAELGAAEWDDVSWHIVQDGLPGALANPEGIANRDKEAFTKLVEGLMLGGFAMQHMHSSRVASGAEHMFSHLLDMEHHEYKGDLVSHGFQVGVGTYYMSKLQRLIVDEPWEKLDVEACCAAWPSWQGIELMSRGLFLCTDFTEVGVKGMQPKYIDAEKLRARLDDWKARWPQIKARLERQLLPPDEIARRLRIVGSPVVPSDIGVTREHWLNGVMRAMVMRDRYNALDFLFSVGKLDEFARHATE